MVEVEVFMFDVIESLNKIATNNLTSPAPIHLVESNKPYKTPSDQVDISQDGALETFRNKVGSLKNDLPGMLANAILAPANASAVQNEPLNAVVFRLTDPLSYILRGDAFTKEQLTGFQREVSKFRDEIMGMKNSEALAPLIQKTQNSDALNKVLFSLTGHLDGVLGQIQDKIMNN